MGTRERCLEAIARLEKDAPANHLAVSRSGMAPVYEILDVTGVCVPHVGCVHLDAFGKAGGDVGRAGKLIIGTSGHADLAGEFFRRILRYDIDQAAGGVATEQGSLRTTKHFDALNIDQVEAERRHDRLVDTVDIDSDVGLIADIGIPGSDAADIRLKARIGPGEDKTRHRLG